MKAYKITEKLPYPPQLVEFLVNNDMRYLPAIVQLLDDWGDFFVGNGIDPSLPGVISQWPYVWVRLEDDND